jgi:Transposase DDE domain/Transposase domain (DUF772)
MQPPVWTPPVVLSPDEHAIVARIRRAKLFIFLRQERHQLFSDAYQAELATLYQESALGRPPVPPARLALTLILQAYTGASDDEAIECLTMDRRWQLVLDCLDVAEPPFHKTTLVAFRQRLIAAQADRRLIERTVDLARTTGLVGSRQLRGALDSSPLWGAGRVEDTYNLLGHALTDALRVIARQQGRGLADTATDLGVTLPVDRSLKAALDLNWDDPGARTQALTTILDALARLSQALDAQPDLLVQSPAVLVPLATAQQVRDQDVTATPDGTPTLQQGVARDRRISVHEATMRHGRKHRTQRVDGYKRHVLLDLDSQLVRAVGVTPANEPEAQVTAALSFDLEAQQVELTELHIDRAYLSSTWVRERAETLTIFCKAWPVRNGSRYAKTAFAVDWEAGTIRCPQGVTQPVALGSTVQFPADQCAVCPARMQCTTSAQGRSVHIHADERLHQELRARQQTAAGRAALRQRIPVEHSLAHLGRWQGDRARYRGERKNLFDLRRMAVVHNLHVLMRQPPVMVAAA